MWLICFKPLGTNNFVPQILCCNEQQAKDWMKNAPFSVVGSYTYMFVPLATPVGYWQREDNFPVPITQEWRPWQIETGGWYN